MPLFIPSDGLTVSGGDPEWGWFADW